MTDTCCEDVWDRHSLHGYRCGKKAKVVVNGKSYCGIHDPSKVKARREKWNQIYNERSEARSRQFATERAYAEIAALTIKYFDQKATFDDLEKAVMEYRKLLEG